MPYTARMKTRALLLLASASTMAACSTEPTPPDDTQGGMTGTAHSMHHAQSEGMASATGAAFATYVPGSSIPLSQLPEATPSTVIDVQDGDVIRLDPTMVRRVIDGAEVFQYGYNGQIPGPTIRARQGDTFVVETTNRIDLPTTIHWHGIRVDSRFDGTPGMSQDPIAPGDSFRYEVTVPDDGIFWYHPHVREDIQLDLGLFGNILVLPADAPAPQADPIMVALDDILLRKDGSLVPYGKDGENFSLMGRFGNTQLVNGVVRPSIAVSAGPQRLYLTNVANTRTYRVSIDGASMRVVGGDVGFGEPYDAAEVILSPAERVIVDVNFPTAGSYTLLHRSTDTTTPLATFTADGGLAAAEKATPESDFPDLAAARLRAPDRSLRISTPSGHSHARIDASGIEWEDSMPMMNERSNPKNTKWSLIDSDTGDANMEIDWKFQKGDLVKIRIKNNFESMQHPIHFHGQRFVVISSNGADVDDFQWKDTYLLKAAETVDILLEASNPGKWMFHCHIAEHLQNGMMGAFTVE